MTRDQAAEELIRRVLAREGGITTLAGEHYVTFFGQTPKWLKEFGFHAPQTSEQAAENYKKWLIRTGLIGLCDYPDVFADAVIDFAIHAGRSVAIKRLQQVLRVPIDGLYGPETQAAVDKADRRATGARIVAARSRHNGRLITDHPDQHSQWAAGWGNRLAEQIEALGQ